MRKQTIRQNSDYEILTPNGFASFSGLVKTEHAEVLRLQFNDSTELICAPNHRLLCANTFIEAQQIEIGTCLGNGVILLSKELLHSPQSLYDPINVEKGFQYNTNNLVSHNCQFIGSSNTLISGEMLTKLQNSYKPPIRTEQNLAIYADPKPGRKYAMTCDVAHGIGQDATAASVFDVTSVPYQQVARYHNVYISPLLLPNILYEIGTAYNNALLLVEVNDIGNQIAEALHYELEYDNLIRTMPQRQQIKLGSGFKPRVLMGLRMTESVKKVGCANLKTLIESGKLIIHDFETISELTTFTQQLQTYKADEGYHDDIAMTLVTFAWMAAQRYFREEQTAVNMSKSMIDEQESDWLSFGFSTVLEDEKEVEAAPVEIGLSENGDRIIWREVNSEFF